MANVKGSQCISMSFESYIASWFRPYSLPLCEISFFINFLTGHKYSLYYNVFCRHGEQVIELLWTGVGGTKQKGRRGMRRAHRYDSSGNSEWRAFWWRQKMVWCSLVESYVSSCWWWKAFVHFLGLASMVTVLKIHSRKMSWKHKQVWAFFFDWWKVVHNLLKHSTVNSNSTMTSRIHLIDLRMAFYFCF